MGHYKKDEKKAQAKDALCGAISSNSSLLSGCDAQIGEVISYLDFILQGSPAGHDEELIGYCKQISELIAQAERALQVASSAASDIKVEKWVEDDEEDGFPPSPQRSRGRRH